MCQNNQDHFLHVAYSCKLLHWVYPIETTPTTDNLYPAQHVRILLPSDARYELDMCTATILYMLTTQNEHPSKSLDTLKHKYLKKFMPASILKLRAVGQRHARELVPVQVSADSLSTKGVNAPCLCELPDPRPLHLQVMPSSVLDVIVAQLDARVPVVLCALWRAEVGLALRQPSRACRVAKAKDGDVRAHPHRHVERDRAGGGRLGRPTPRRITAHLRGHLLRQARAQPRQRDALRVLGD
eukprot:6200722-Pleurochrysis_carterae.AAC.3